MTWFSLGPFYIQILYSFTWLLVCCWFWSHSCIVTVKLNNQTNISANQTQIFTQLNLYCMYNMCPEMCPRKWCGRKTAWKKLCCSRGICQMYSILFCKQWPMYARNISCLVLSWLTNLESCHCQNINMFRSSWLILKICSSLKSSLCGDSPANPSQFYEVSIFYNFIIYIARSLASLLIIIPWHRFHRSSSLVKSKRATNELLHRS